ncbi:hypothetical protein GCM10009677_34620 [Sphaerisporangium rubeum]|uniref:LapA family protein n=1 Tax=Sphaerisporangium rubeum TaxID=321317 RepID=A0A7X0IFD2_9ACTN|nr:hypothetical protein [Sphaerisporangium rubeum]MBB6474224.1 hypothetical protein [Sphaerisporangium rubeum]
MILLGLLLIVIAGAALIAVANDMTGNAAMSVTVFDRVLQFNELELFLAGAATAAIFLLGLMVFTMGMRRMGARRRQLMATRRESRERVARLEEEKRRLEQRLETVTTPRPRTSPDAAPAPAAPTAPAGRHASDRDGDGVDDRAERGRATQPTRHPDDRLVAGNRSERADA